MPGEGCATFSREARPYKGRWGPAFASTPAPTALSAHVRRYEAPLTSSTVPEHQVASGEAR